MIIGFPGLQNILGEYKYFYNHYRSHQGIDNKVPGSNDRVNASDCLRDRI